MSNNKEQSSIPTGKVARASEFVKTGIKIGGNYVKYYAAKAMNGETTKDQLHDDNANDIYNSLSTLKGSALKVAQMMSMDRSMLPKAYVDRFQLSQYSAPPLSAPLVIRTFIQQVGKTPQQLFDKFDPQARNAASIGQVHEAYKDGKRLAVKIQYPGVATSIASDLKMVKPFAVRLMGLNEADVDRYMSEVEGKLLEETDYALEIRRGQEISAACAHLIGLKFPEYYPAMSGPRIITMEWLDGLHLKDFLSTNPSQAVRDKIGQSLWDFYEYQIHNMMQVHADPHPGNFLMQADGTLGIIDFGCVKELPKDFYYYYFSLINPQSIQDNALMLRLFYALEFVYPDEDQKTQDFFIPLFREMIELLGRPFCTETFDFSDKDYFDRIYKYAEELGGMKEIRNSKVARGSKDGLYINRTYYGLYSMLNDLGSVVKTHSKFKGVDPLKLVAQGDEARSDLRGKQG
jgi:predicted unusual protein kinase regulating ubiquinone biosynthesis (AarF/ABC1/UbiB family)